jgi:nitroreductase
MDLLERLNWRYATKKMDPLKSVPQEKVDRILEAIRLAPTSSGMQPFEIIVVTNKVILEKIRLISGDKSQITECSHLLVFAAWDNYTPERINAVFDLNIVERGGTSDRYEAYRHRMIENYKARDIEINFQHAAKQA